MSEPTFPYDVFLSHSSKDKAVVRPLAERLRADGLNMCFDQRQIRLSDSIPTKIKEGLERSRVLVLCISTNAFWSGWAQLEAGRFRFRKPLFSECYFFTHWFEASLFKRYQPQLLNIDKCLGSHSMTQRSRDRQYSTEK